MGKTASTVTRSKDIKTMLITKERLESRKFLLLLGLIIQKSFEDVESQTVLDNSDAVFVLCNEYILRTISEYIYIAEVN